MARKRQRSGRSGKVLSFLNCLRQFLTPQVWKQAHRVAPKAARPGAQRWPLHPLLLTLMVMTWCAGDSQEERFETARAFYVATAPKRRRPGQTAQGFRQALSRLPCRVLRLLASALRQRLLRQFLPYLHSDGFVPIGCDGSRLACPRTAELEQRLGQGSQSSAPPQLWLTALVHLRLGLLWSWRLGKGNASERQHLKQLLPTLPANALLIADAGYQGYELIGTLMATAGVCFLIRVSSQTLLYAVEGVPPTTWTDGWVWWWPVEAQRQEQPPLCVRLLRVPGRKVDVWLVTNVAQPTRLSLPQAAKFYRMRWENEGFFRTYKRTLQKVKLSSRSVRLVHREAEGSLLAVQLLLAQGAWAVAALSQQPSARSSPRQALREIRKEIEGQLGPRQRRRFGQRLAQAQREQRPQRTSSKVKRVWPSRTNHKPPKPPKVRQLTKELKRLLQQYFQRAEAA